jgi:four helix bundle protein
MAKIERFEDIQAWQKARELNNEIYTITMDSGFAKDFSLRDQLRRASVSIMANIAEGFGRRSKKEFANFLNMAHGSAAEVQCHLYVALDQNYINQDTFHKLYDKTDEVSKITQGFIKYLRA